MKYIDKFLISVSLFLLKDSIP